jgi:hypothetical protein
LVGAGSLVLTKGAADYKGEGASYPFTIDAAYKSTPLQIKVTALGSANYAASDVGVYIYDVTNATLITPAAVNIAAGTTTLNSFFVATTSTSYRLCVHIQSTNASSYTLQLDNVSVGPQSIGVGAAVTDFKSYTPTIGSTGSSPTKGTIVRDLAVYRRVGDSLEVMYDYDQNVAGASGTGVYTYSLPSGLTIDSTKQYSLSLLAQGNVGEGIFYDGTTARPAQVYTYSSTSVSIKTLNSGTLTDVGASNYGYGGGTLRFSFWFKVPIAEWSSSNFQTADRAVEEYAYNTSSSTTTSDTTSFGYGTAGNVIGSITAALSRRVRFQTPIQTTDYLVVEVKDPTVGKWFPVASNNITVGAASCQALTVQNGVEYGVGIYQVVNSTDVDVRFGQYSAASGATYGAAGQAWSTGAGTAYFRVKKVSGGATVGYPVSSANIVGRTDGNSASTGYIGEKLTGTMTSPALTAGVPKDFGTISLNKGGYLVFASAYLSGNASLTIKRAWLTIGTAADTTDVTNAADFSNSNAGYDSIVTHSRFINISSDSTTIHAVMAWDGAGTCSVTGASSTLYAIRIY